MVNGIIYTYICTTACAFSDTEEFGATASTRPIWANIVRHPLERVRSWYYYVRGPAYQMEPKGNLNGTMTLKGRASIRSLKKTYEECVMEKVCVCL